MMTNRIREERRLARLNLQSVLLSRNAASQTEMRLFCKLLEALKVAPIASDRTTGENPPAVQTEV